LSAITPGGDEKAGLRTCGSDRRRRCGGCRAEAPAAGAFMRLQHFIDAGPSVKSAWLTIPAQARIFP
jgi:hypothetical protein